MQRAGLISAALCAITMFASITAVGQDGFFADVQHLGAGINTARVEWAPNISCDGLTLVYHSGGDLYEARRRQKGQPFQIIEKLGPPVNTTSNEHAGSLSRDGLTLYFSSSRPGFVGGADLFVARRTDRALPFEGVQNIGGLNTRFMEAAPIISCDDLILLFHSTRRPGGLGARDIWVSTRETAADPSAHR